MRVEAGPTIEARAFDIGDGEPERPVLSTCCSHPRNARSAEGLGHSMRMQPMHNERHRPPEPLASDGRPLGKVAIAGRVFVVPSLEFERGGRLGDATPRELGAEVQRAPAGWKRVDGAVELRKEARVQPRVVFRDEAQPATVLSRTRIESHESIFSRQPDLRS